MSWDALLPSLMFMTIGIVLIAAIIQFAMFLRRKRNREAAANAFRGDERSALARKAEETTAPPERPPRR
jgi:heme/copper-type cytochrome/quinol oxidase subunit 2